MNQEERINVVKQYDGGDFHAADPRPLMSHSHSHAQKAASVIWHRLTQVIQCLRKGKRMPRDKLLRIEPWSGGDNIRKDGILSD